ncbi:MAG TPA: recombination-associated protein RdgC [Thiothrix sp.]|nr:recombination-associated protein RdgC [Thiothrix sp.]
MWFKNLYLFKFEQEFTQSADELHDVLSRKPFTPCGATQRESMGWVAPLGKNANALTHSANGFILLSMARQERLLPASVVREEVDERVTEIEHKEDRKVTAKEKKELRENIEHELLPRAFTRTQKMDAWIDPKGDWLVIDSASAPRAETFTKLLRKTLGTLPIALPDTEVTPATAMTAWLQEDNLPEPFLLGAECELKTPDEAKSSAVFKNHELLSDEVQTNLKKGKYVAKLALIWSDKISFVVTEELQIKKLKFLDVMKDELQESDAETHEDHIDIEFTLMTGEVSAMLVDLLDSFND